jgi:UPF0755 protein
VSGGYRDGGGYDGDGYGSASGGRGGYGGDGYGGRGGPDGRPGPRRQPPPPRREPSRQEPPRVPRSQPAQPPRSRSPQDSWDEPPQDSRRQPPRRYQSGGYQADSYDGTGGGDPFLPGFGDRDDDYGDSRRGPRGAGRGGWDADGGRGDYADRGDYGDRGDRDYDDDYDSRDNLRVPKRKRGPVRRLAPWIALVVVLVPAVIAALYVYHLYQAKYHPPDYAGPGSSPSVTVQVAKGATPSGLAPELVSSGVVESDRAFILAAEHSTNTASLEPGTYKLNTHMQASLAYAALLNPKNRVQDTITIPEGKRVAQVIATLASDMHVPVSDFETIVANPSQLGLPSYAKASVPGFNGIGYKVEGFLWPSQYVIQPHETPLQVLQAMVAQFNQVSKQQNLPAEAAARHLTMQQLIIEASIVQAEAGTTSQMPKIARVIENRLDTGMKLQFDSVLEYGLDKFAVNIQDSWATIPGPYNNFQNQGLPPTPISNPGMAAINAVLHPASGNWLFFLAYPNGSSVFCLTQPTGLSCPNP